MKKNEKQLELSYESDGVMGKEQSPKHKSDKEKIEAKEFFNTTQASE
jgi:hypothetical protein